MLNIGETIRWLRLQAEFYKAVEPDDSAVMRDNLTAAADHLDRVVLLLAKWDDCLDEADMDDWHCERKDILDEV